MRQERDRRSIRVAVAHESYLVREFLTSVLDRSQEAERTAVCSNGDDLESAIVMSPPHVVLTGVRLPPSGADEGIRIAARLRETSPHVGVVLLGDRVEPSSIIAFLGQGTSGRGYLLTERVRGRDEVIEAIQAVATGGSVLDPLILDAVVHERGRTACSPLSELTPREHEVLSKIAVGDSNGAIAKSLSLTQRAVEKHINSIFLKLGLRHRANVSRRVTATRIFLAEAAAQGAGALDAGARSNHPGIAERVASWPGGARLPRAQPAWQSQR